MPLARWRNGRASHTGKTRPVRGIELQPFPRNPTQRASYGLNAEDDANRAGACETNGKLPKLGRSHPAGCPIMPEFLDDYFASDRGRKSQTLRTHKRRICTNVMRSPSHPAAITAIL